MKIQFQHRISGISRIAYRSKTVECTNYRILNPGDEYISPMAGKRKCTCYALQIDDKGVYQLKPGSKVIEV